MNRKENIPPKSAKVLKHAGKGTTQNVQTLQKEKDTNPVFIRQLWDQVRTFTDSMDTSQRVPSRTSTGASIGPSQQRKFVPGVLKPCRISIDESPHQISNACPHFGLSVPSRYESFNCNTFLNYDDDDLEEIRSEYVRMHTISAVEAEYSHVALTYLLRDRDRRTKTAENTWQPTRKLGFVCPADEYHRQKPPVLDPHDPQIQPYRWDLRPDCAYWLNVDRWYSQYRNLFSRYFFVDMTTMDMGPYFTIEIKREDSNPTVWTARRQIAAAAAIHLFNRWKLSCSVVSEPASNTTTSTITTPTTATPTTGAPTTSTPTTATLTTATPTTATLTTATLTTATPTTAALTTATPTTATLTTAIPTTAIPTTATLTTATPTTAALNTAIPTTATLTTTTPTAKASKKIEKPEELVHYGLILCGSQFEMWIMSINYESDLKTWNGCTMTVLAKGSCMREDDLGNLIEWINEVHYWGLGVHATRLDKELQHMMEADRIFPGRGAL